MSSKFACLKNAIVDGIPEEPAIIHVVTERLQTKQWKDGVTIKEVVRTLNSHKDPQIQEVTIAAVKSVMESMAMRGDLVRIPGQFTKPGNRGIQARYLLSEVVE